METIKEINMFLKRTDISEKLRFQLEHKKELLMTGKIITK
jgi:hypothetical protein